MSDLKREIEKIHDKTDFKVEFAGVTQLGEFKYSHGGAVQPGMEYHIHYTNDKIEVFMTGAIHNSNSKIIKKVSGDESLFSTYSKNKSITKRPYPKKYNPRPTESDYSIGQFNRYFTQKANDLNGEIFEVSEEDFNTPNNLFRYFKIKWVISGLKNNVIRENRSLMNTLLKTRGNENITKLLFPLQFWNPPKGSTENIRQKLSRRKIM